MKKLLSLFMAFAAMAFVVSPALAATSVVYDALPSVDPATSYPSQPFQAQRTVEFGDSIHLGGTDRILNSATVTMVTWAPFASYETDPRYLSNSTNWVHPITLNVYSTSLDSNGVPNELLATTTQDIVIPWRPAHDPSCPGTTWKTANGDCYNGFAFNATFDLSILNQTLPDDIIVTVAYNTQSYGVAPIGVNGPYNSLNVAVPENQPVAIGSDNDVDATFWDSTYGGRTAGLKVDTGWTPYGTVALKIETTSPKDECKNGGWESFSNPAFKNQGECVSYLQSNENAGKRD